jgi:hypothetical protein
MVRYLLKTNTACIKSIFQRSFTMNIPVIAKSLNLPRYAASGLYWPSRGIFAFKRGMAIITAIAAIMLAAPNPVRADSTSAAAVAPDTAPRIETAVPLKVPAELFKDSMESFGGGVYFGWGAYSQPLGDLNEVLTNHHFKTLNPNMTLFSCGFFGLSKPRNHFGFDFEYFWSEPASSMTDTSVIGSVEAHGYRIGFKTGYDLLGRPRWGIVPMFGAGYFWHTYDFKTRFSRFDDIFKGSSPEAIQLKYSGLALTAGVNVYIKTKMDKPRKENGKLHEPLAGLNLEGGVNYYPLRKAGVGGKSVDNCPPMSRYGIYTKLCLDLGERASPLPNPKKD